MDKNQLSLKVTLNVKMCSRVRNQLAKAFELNVKESCNLIIINNLEECVDNKQMVCKDFGKVDPYGKNLAVFPALSTKDQHLMWETLVMCS